MTRTRRLAFGVPQREVRAPRSGMLLIMLGTPPVRTGETIAVIAHVGGEAW
ncbi:MAG: hypothetical protein AAFU79_28590 [Myxococcota bacterium]